MLCVPRKNNTFPLFYSIQVLLSAVFWACRTKIMEMLCAQLLFKMKQKKRKIEEQLKPALSLEELREWAKGKLAPYKVLQHGQLCLFLFSSLLSIT